MFRTVDTLKADSANAKPPYHHTLVVRRLIMRLLVRLSAIGCIVVAGIGFSSGGAHPALAYSSYGHCQRMAEMLSVQIASADFAYPYGWPAGVQQSINNNTYTLNHDCGSGWD